MVWSGFMGWCVERVAAFERRRGVSIRAALGAVARLGARKNAVK
jgi:hypothetical protein